MKRLDDNLSKKSQSVSHAITMFFDEVEIGENKNEESSSILKSKKSQLLT